MPASDLLTFPAGAGPLEMLVFAVNTTDDEEEEAPEVIQVVARIQGTVGMFVDGGDMAQVTITIIDNDGFGKHCS